jgi:hypothetical protein
MNGLPQVLLRAFSLSAILACTGYGGDVQQADMGFRDMDFDFSVPPPHITVTVTNDWETFLNLDKPTDKFDEPSFGGFNYLISGARRTSLMRTCISTLVMRPPLRRHWVLI